MKGILIVILIAFCHQSYGQSISDLEFVWTGNDNCKRNDFAGEVFQIVEIAPRLLNCTSARLSDILEILSDSLKLKEAVSGDLSVKLLFFQGESICVRRLGTKGLLLSKYESGVIMDYFNDFVDFIPGKQGNTNRNCEGTLFLNIRRGKIHGYGLANFETTQR